MSSASGTLSLPPSVVTPYLLNSLIEAITLAVADASVKVLDPGSRKLAAQMAVPPVPVPVVVADAAKAETAAAAADAAADETAAADAAADETAATAERQELLNQIADSSKDPSDRLNWCCTLIRSDQKYQAEGRLGNIVERTHQLAGMLTQDRKQNSDQQDFGLVLRTVVLLQEIGEALTLCNQPTYSNRIQGKPLYDKDLIPGLNCIFEQAKLFLDTLPKKFPDNLLKMFKVDGEYDKNRILQPGTRADPGLLDKLGLTDSRDEDLAKLSKQFVEKLFVWNGRIFVPPTRLVSPPKPVGEESVNEPAGLMAGFFEKLSRGKRPPVEKS